MPGIHKFRESLLRDGKISSTEVEVIKEFVTSDGILDYEDVKFLVSLMKEAHEVCEEFEEVLFRCMRHVFLADGDITPDEQYLLLHMLYSDGNVRNSERRFIAELYRDVEHVSPEFQTLCETALSSPSSNWSLD